MTMPSLEDYVNYSKDRTLDRLQAWLDKHKSHSVQIGIDDGYGATCWTVELGGHGIPEKKVVAAEVSFWEIPDGGPPRNIFFSTKDDGKGDWPGLAATINLAIDKAEELGL
jgi:hypothetical protein